MITVFSSNGVRAVLLDLAPEFERRTGHTLAITFDPANALKERIARGETFDAAILTPPVMAEMIAQEKIVSGSPRTIARVGCGLAVRAGGAKPDTATVDGFKRTLLAAKSIARTRVGASGIHFTHLIKTLGIADAVDRKSRFVAGGLTAELAASGETELAVQLISELKAVAGVDIVEFPAPLQEYVVMVGGVSAAAKEPQTAAALLAVLSGPDAAPVLRAKGMEPAQSQN
ncbi:MAG TPA: substrate-binding domain-containing protein [Alphaproteobacteria bacterium]